MKSSRPFQDAAATLRCRLTNVSKAGQHGFTLGALPGLQSEPWAPSLWRGPRPAAQVRLHVKRRGNEGLSCLFLGKRQLCQISDKACRDAAVGMRIMGSLARCHRCCIAHAAGSDHLPRSRCAVLPQRPLARTCAARYRPPPPSQRLAAGCRAPVRPSDPCMPLQAHPRARKRAGEGAALRLAGGGTRGGNVAQAIRRQEQGTASQVRRLRRDWCNHKFPQSRMESMECKHVHMHLSPFFARLRRP